MEEFEIKFLEVDVPTLEKKLIEIGAEKVTEYDYSRAIFYISEHNIDSGDGWVRVRTDGKETTLTYKKSIKEKSDDRTSKDVGMKEIEVTVDSYEKTYELIKSIGLILKREEKNRRIRYVRGDVAFDIDFWPGIPTYLEIESSSFEKVKNAASELGFNSDKGIIGTAGSVYKKYGFDINDYSSITFEGMIKK